MKIRTKRRLRHTSFFVYTLSQKKQACELISCSEMRIDLFYELLISRWIQQHNQIRRTTK